MKIISLCFISMALFGSVANAGDRTINTITTSSSVRMKIRLFEDSDSSSMVKILLTSPQIVVEKNMYIPETSTVVRSKDKILFASHDSLGKGGEFSINLPATSLAAVLNSVQRNGSQFVSISDKNGSGVDQLLALLMTLSGPNVQKYFSNGAGDPKVPNAVRVRLDGPYENPIDCFPSYERNGVTCQFHIVPEAK